MGGWNEGLWAIVPTICVSLIFWFVMRAILRADRTEREAQARYRGGGGRTAPRAGRAGHAGLTS